MVRGI